MTYFLDLASAILFTRCTSFVPQLYLLAEQGKIDADDNQCHPPRIRLRIWSSMRVSTKGSTRYCVGSQDINIKRRRRFNKRRRRFIKRRRRFNKRRRRFNSAP